MSSHFQSQNLTAQNVEVQMMHGLTGIGAAVGNHTIAVFQIFSLGDLGNNFKNVGNDVAVFRCDAIHRGNVGLGNHQNVGRSLGRDIPKGQNQLILINLGGGDLPCDDLAEQTVSHKMFPPQRWYL